jgi:lysophospholipase L1-like esterase
LALLAGAVAAELLVERLDVFGVRYYGEVQRYLREAIALAPPEEVSPTGRIFQNKPDVHLALLHFDYRTDARGLRTEAGRAPPADAQRILFLGDSVTLAWGVDDAESWPRLLEQRARAIDGRPLECMNAGHLMYDTTQMAGLLRGWGPELAPEIVVLTFNFNDLHPTWDQLVAMHLPETAAGAAPVAAEGEHLGWRETLFSRSFPSLRALWRFGADKRRLAREDRSTIPPYSYYPSGWPRCETALDELAATTAALGARLVINDHTLPIIPEVAAWCERHGVPRIETALSEEEQRRWRNSVIDTHLNAAGNARVAELALEGLASLGVVARAE